MGDTKTFSEKAEGLLKLAGAAVGILVVFGYPAIYYQLKRFDLPLHVVDYKNVFYAGIIPTLIFVGFFAYAYWVYLQLQKK